jgi:hypothetical protein
MQAEIETLERTAGGWWLRFCAAPDIMLAVKARVNATLHPLERFWDRNALGGRGAWFVQEEALEKIAPLFSNYAGARWMAEQAVRERREVAARMREESRYRRAEKERQHHQAAWWRMVTQARMPTDAEASFTLLGLPATASVGRIRAAYHRLALQCHPDRGGSHRAMVALNRAYHLALAHARANAAA